MVSLDATVAIVARDEGEHIVGAIRSVTAQGRGVQVLVVDDHSTDATVQLALASGAVVVSNRGRGIVDARNTALAVVDTEVLVWLDADDRLLPGSLDAVLAAFAHRCIDLVVGSPRFVDVDGTVIAHQPTPPDAARCRIVAMAFNPFSQSAVAVRRGAVLAVGGYRAGSETDAAEDYDLWARLLRSGVEMVGLAQPTVTMAIRPTSLTVRSAAPQSRRAAAIRRELRKDSDGDLASSRTLGRLCRELPFSWRTPTPLDTFALGLLRLAVQLTRTFDLGPACRVLCGAALGGPARVAWSASRAAAGFRRRRRARGWAR
ncbi:MAG: glycosyltransferase family 2 protein [Ilumatobacteraceae bacterium]